MKKKDSLNQPNKTLNFWLCAGLLVVLLASILARDITRPFYGLHSWADASGSWAARTHAKYGLGYTKGMTTWAVGQPPTQNPKRYVDHPQLFMLTSAVFMKAFGYHEYTHRIIRLMASTCNLLLFLAIMRRLVDQKTALLTGLFYVLFPLIGFFGTGAWPQVFHFWAFWAYLAYIGELKEADSGKPIHKWTLAASLFLMLQLSWSGFFFAFAIGLHYVCRCIHKKQLPEKMLLAILIVAPLSSLALDFTIMAGGYGWDFQKIIDLYKWRSAKGEMPEFLWGAWFAKFWEFAITNFTLPILITAIVYLTFGQLFVFMETKPEKTDKRRPRQFPQFWLFLMPGIFQLFILRGCLWKHQTWERPLAPFVAIATALGVMLLGDILRKINRRLAIAGMVTLVGVIVGFCVLGTNYYHGIRWQAPEKIRMFKMLNQKIPPDKYLLSFEDFIVNQHKSKGGFYRPEYAWYLDREIVQARTLAEVQKYAETDRFPYYLVPAVDQLSPLIGQLQKHYKLFKYIPGNPGETKNGKFYRAGMMSYMIFDLTTVVPNP